jgi:hypothetical protein
VTNVSEVTYVPSVVPETQASSFSPKLICIYIGNNLVQRGVRAHDGCTVGSMDLVVSLPPKTL